LSIGANFVVARCNPHTPTIAHGKPEEPGISPPGSSLALTSEQDDVGGSAYADFFKRIATPRLQSGEVKTRAADASIARGDVLCKRVILGRQGSKIVGQRLVVLRLRHLAKLGRLLSVIRCPRRCATAYQIDG